jgi:hypothetical protein
MARSTLAVVLVALIAASLAADVAAGEFSICSDRIILGSQTHASLAHNVARRIISAAGKMLRQVPLISANLPLKTLAIDCSSPSPVDMRQC